MDFFTGQIIPMAITYAPKQTAFCNGQLLPVNQNAALITLLGMAFGGTGQRRSATTAIATKLASRPDRSQYGDL